MYIFDRCVNWVSPLYYCTCDFSHVKPEGTQFRIMTELSNQWRYKFKLQPFRIVGKLCKGNCVSIIIADPAAILCMRIFQYWLVFVTEHLCCNPLNDCDFSGCHHEGFRLSIYSPYTHRPRSCRGGFRININNYSNKQVRFTLWQNEQLINLEARVLTPLEVTVSARKCRLIQKLDNNPGTAARLDPVSWLDSNL